MPERQSGQDGKLTNRVNPEGVLSCIWVDAGLVSYKLCDYDFECEACAFDQVMRQRSHRTFKTPVQSKIPLHKEKYSNGPPEYGDTPAGLVRQFLLPSGTNTLPPGRFYSGNYVWAKRVEDDRYRIGLNEHIVSLFHDTWNVILPQPGSVSRRNAPLAWIILEDGTIVVRSPLDGKISKSNFQLRESPSLINSDPYEAGWICEVEGVELKKVEPVLMDETAAKIHYDSQFRDLEKSIISDLESKPDRVGLTMMDGGVKPKILKDILGPRKYISLLKRLLSSDM